MRIETLLSPGSVSNAYDLRRHACKAICAAEIYLSDERRDELAAFFLDCARHAAAPKKVKAVIPVDPIDTV